MENELHFCADNLEYDWKNSRHTFYHCKKCNRLIKIRNTELNKLNDE